MKNFFAICISLVFGLSNFSFAQTHQTAMPKLAPQVKKDETLKKAPQKKSATPSKTSKSEKSNQASGKLQVLQEGWYKVLIGKQHAGYFVQRFEYDSKTKNYISTTFLRTGALGNDITESVKAFATEKLNPISYQYTNAQGKTLKTIDATFEKEKMVTIVTDQKESKKYEYKIPKGTFLTQFLIYVMLKSPSGLKVGQNYEYSGVAEEEGHSYKGEAFVSGTEKIGGELVFKILNSFKGTKFISYVRPSGEAISTKSPVESIETKLTSREESSKGFSVPEQNLRLLFGSIPEGIKPMGDTSSLLKEEAAKKTDTSSETIPKDKKENLSDTLPDGVFVPPGKPGKHSTQDAAPKAKDQ